MRLGDGAFVLGPGEARMIDVGGFDVTLRRAGRGVADRDGRNRTRGDRGSVRDGGRGRRPGWVPQGATERRLSDRHLAGGRLWNTLCSDRRSNRLIAMAARRVGTHWRFQTANEDRSSRTSAADWNIVRFQKPRTAARGAAQASIGTSDVPRRRSGPRNRRPRSRSCRPCSVSRQARWPPCRTGRSSPRSAVPR